MSPLGRICTSCQRFTPDAVDGRCAASYAVVDGARRYARAKRDGRDSKAWRKLSKAVRARDGRCLHCGATRDLVAHFLGRGRHTSRLADFATLCRSCSGSLHAPEARR